MNLANLKNLLAELKLKEGFQVYDSHVHPLDLFGLSSNAKRASHAEFLPINKPSLLEKMDYSNVANLLLRCCYAIYPRVVKENIVKNFMGANSARLIRTMDESLVDKAILVPIAPFLKLESFDEFAGSKFIKLSSLDLRKLELHEIEPLVISHIKYFGIKGIKIHPNLQGVFPQPSQNQQYLREKLIRLYEVICRYKLYALFHGGYTNLSERIVDKNLFRSSVSKNALLSNFIDYEGRSELFENYDMPVVIAHLGNYARIRQDRKNVRTILRKYGNVFFDTAGIGSNLFESLLSQGFSHRLVFGSDALYHDMNYAVLKCCNSIKKIFRNNAEMLQAMKSVFSDTIVHILNE